MKTANKPPGFTLIELLILLAILAVLFSMAAMSFGKARQRLDLESFAHQISQDLKMCRSLAISKSKFCRVDFGPNGYNIDLSDDGSSWTTKSSFSLPSRVTASWSSGDEIIFDSRGFGDFPASPSPYQVSISDGTNKLIIVPSMTGSARVVKP